MFLSSLDIYRGKNYILYMKAIRTYETKEEYLNDVENLPVPSISYVKETDETFKRSIKPVQVMRLWVDDFTDGYPGGCQSYQEFIDDPESCGSNAYVYTGDIWEYNDNRYYLWEREDGYSCPAAFLMTVTDDYQSILNTTLKYRFERYGNTNVNWDDSDFAGFLDEDSEYYVGGSPSERPYEHFVKLDYTTAERVVDEKIGE